jgi:hypothetical protein
MHARAQSCFPSTGIEVDLIFMPVNVGKACREHGKLYESVENITIRVVKQ